MDDYGCVWNFERLPELNGLQVERFVSPNPIPKTVRGTLVSFSRSKGAHFFRFARLAMARTNQGKPQSQKANGA